MKLISLFNKDGNCVGKTILDDEDYTTICNNRYTIGPDGKGYAYIYFPLGHIKRRKFLHRFILELHGVNLVGKLVDHINFNKLDNRLINLRSCSARQNCAHTAKRMLKTPYSKYKGVYKDKHYYVARIGDDFLGNFENEIDAAVCYDIFAKERYGEFSIQNVPEVSSEDLNRVRNILSKKQKRHFRKSKLGYKGVTLHGRKYRARIIYNGERVIIGDFLTPEEAAEAYNKMAIQYFGNGAVLNNIR